MEKEISPVCNLEKERCLAKRRPGHECPAWVPSLALLPNSDLEGTARDMGTIELDVDGVDAILMGDETDGVLVCGDRGWSVSLSLFPPLSRRS